MAGSVQVLVELGVGCLAGQPTREGWPAAFWETAGFSLLVELGAFLVPVALWGTAEFLPLGMFGVGWWGKELEEWLPASQIEEGLLSALPRTPG